MRPSNALLESVFELLLATRCAATVGVTSLVSTP